MKLHAVLIALATGLLPAADVKEDPKDKLQGAWTCTKMERGGMEIKDSVGDTFTVKGDKFTIKTKNETMEGTLKIGEVKKGEPVPVDMTMKDPSGKDMTMKGLYQIEGEMIKFCFPFGDPSKFGNRPVKIAATADTMVVTMKKEKK